jgi:hypothetical protein
MIKIPEERFLLMNRGVSRMVDRDLKVVQRTFLKLLQDLGLVASALDTPSLGSPIAPESVEMASEESQENRLPALNWFHDLAVDAHPFDRSNTLLPLWEDLSYQPGEIPAVQDRFYALLKRRLQTEIQRNPPLFPWEKELSEYPPESADYGLTHPAMASSLLMAQLRGLALPIPMPEALLADLLSRCQAVATSSLKEGVKLVKAVEEWFPNQSPLLNQLAGMVMVAPARGSSLQQQLEKLAGENLPSSYDVAMPTQQMTLSLLAAREILNLLTVTVSSQQPRAERHWMTNLGALDLQIEYLAATPRLRLLADLPIGGSLQIQSDGVRSLVERPDAGELILDLPDPEFNHTYSLEVRLDEQSVLVFAISVTAK